MNSAYGYIINLLAKREHSAYELIEKLAKKGYNPKTIEEAIAKSQDLDLQSDQRFAESLVRRRLNQGYGPSKIIQDLYNEKVAAELIEQALSPYQEQWLAYAETVWQKKISSFNELSWETLQKLQRFMLYRGFSMDVINTLAKQTKDSLYCK